MKKNPTRFQRVAFDIAEDSIWPKRLKGMQPLRHTAGVHHHLQWLWSYATGGGLAIAAKYCSYPFCT